MLAIVKLGVERRAGSGFCFAWVFIINKNNFSLTAYYFQSKNIFLTVIIFIFFFSEWFFWSLWQNLLKETFLTTSQWLFHTWLHPLSPILTFFCGINKLAERILPSFISDETEGQWEENAFRKPYLAWMIRSDDLVDVPIWQSYLLKTRDFRVGLLFSWAINQ